LYDTVEWRVVNALADDGIFRVGGVLVGTIAYRCIVNLMGVQLLSAVEFLTPLMGRNGVTGKRAEIRQLGVPAIALRFLDYLIEEPLPAVALGRRPVLVRVPQPARYAVHKLIVARERARTFALKAQKDLEQSFDLQKALEKLDPESLAEAFKDARKKGPAWRKRVDDGQEAMRRMFG
jgi:hypothetical protein